MSIRIGDAGVALSSLHPQGMVQVGGRRFHARAEHGSLSPESSVVVVGGDHLGLIVREAGPDGPANGLPGYGTRVYSSFIERLADREVRDEGERERLREDRRKRGSLWFAALGAVCAAAVLFLVWDHVTEEPGPTWQMAVMVAAAGALLGAGLFLSLHQGLARFDGGTGRVIAACTSFALTGGVVGAAVGIPAFGLVGGISLALVGMAALGMALPLLLVAGENVGGAA
jgi:hypothetical protein